MDWETVIGLEIHVQLATYSKIFSGSSTTYGAPPNTQASAVDLGLPGVLPVLNEEVVRMAVMFGLAVDASITPRSVFARKNYFYPDLPKGYQISQFELPVVHHGGVEIDLGDSDRKRIEITRAHLEEDAGKSLHEEFPDVSGIDLNRAGTPLLEIVSEPDMRSAKEAVAYMRKIHSIVRYLGICDGNMQEGSLRCDANVSIRRRGEVQLGTRTELKNLNSFRFVERAINHEVERQIDQLERGKRIVQETRHYDPQLNETRPLRSKEEAHDYRYFPDPDLLPVEILPDYVEAVAATLPELPDQKKRRFVEDYGLSSADAAVLTARLELSQYFEETVSACPGAAKLIANWVMGDLTSALNRAGDDIESNPVSPAMLAVMVKRIADKTISGKIAKQVFEAMYAGEGDADSIIEREGLLQVTDTGEIEALVDGVVAANPEQVAQFRAGKTKVLGFFVGQVMEASQGKANPQQVNDLLRAKLN